MTTKEIIGILGGVSFGLTLMGLALIDPTLPLEILLLISCGFMGWMFTQ